VACHTIPCIINAQLVCEETGFRKHATKARLPPICYTKKGAYLANRKLGTEPKAFEELRKGRRGEAVKATELLAVD